MHTLEQIKAHARTSTVFDVTQDVYFQGFLHVLPSGQTLVCQCDQDTFYWSADGQVLSEQAARALLARQ